MSEIEEWLKYADLLSQRAKENFGSLSYAQLNWKPAPDKWSVGECLKHLIHSNETYYSQFELLLSGKKKKTFWESIPGLPRMWGSMLKKSTGPVVTTKAKSPKAFRIDSSQVDTDIIEQFLRHQEKLKDFIRRLGKLDLDKTVITSPAAAMITYSLRDTFDILLPHEERHIGQAERVMALEPFPK